MSGRGQFTLQICGVLGASPSDPEICYERLVAAAAPGSALHLWCENRGRVGEIGAIQGMDSERKLLMGEEKSQTTHLKMVLLKETLVFQQ